MTGCATFENGKVISSNEDFYPYILGKFDPASLSMTQQQWNEAVADTLKT